MFVCFIGFLILILIFCRSLLSYTSNDPFPFLSFLYYSMVMSEHTHSNATDRLSQEVATALDLKLTAESTLHLETPVMKTTRKLSSH